MDSQDILENIARVILSELTNFDKTFKARPLGQGDALAYPDPTARSSLNRILSTVQGSQHHLLDEPFIAYVKVEVDGQERILFICREYTPTGYTPAVPSGAFASYRSPLGRAAEVKVGTEFEFSVKHGLSTEIHEVRVLEKNLFRPKKQGSSWDGVHDNFFLETGTYTIKSLLEFLRAKQVISEKQRALAEAEAVNELEHDLRQISQQRIQIKSGLIREVIQKIELRDQPILDSSQGPIFRLPLSSQIIITGAPGTGKTTTLIKRIAQKSSPEFLGNEEKAGLDNQQISYFFHKQNWLLFTPTELLKIYLKEALAKEHLPASDQTVKVWEDERLIIARDVLKFLRVGGHGMYQRLVKPLVRATRNADLIAYAKDFIASYCRYILNDFNKALATLRANNTSRDLLNGFQQIHQRVISRQMRDIDEDQVFLLVEELAPLREAFNLIHQKLDNGINRIVDAVLKSKPGILQQVYSIIQSQKAEQTQTEEEEGLDGEGIDDMESEPVTMESAILAKRQIRRTLAWYAEKLSNSDVRPQTPMRQVGEFGQFLEKIAKDTSSSRREIHAWVLNVISHALPDAEDLIDIGKQIRDRKVTDALTRGYENLLDRIPHYYHRFRIEQLEKSESLLNSTYEREIKGRRISDHEIDLLIFVMLKNARKIFDRQRELLEINSRIRILESIKSKYHSQVGVDEAVDFSTLQLGSMFYLAHPRYTSVSLSGDLMQRVTQFGLMDWHECQFISTSLQQWPIEKVYRQSPKLLRIAQELYERVMGEKPQFHSAFDDTNTDPDPLLFCSQDDEERLGQWMAERIVEIYNINSSLPSTAIFVADEDQIEPVRRMLEEPLGAHSIGVKGCPRGEILGSEGKVRIFSIKYIKGLEFESVFLVNLDQISEREPHLVDKYLYVGLTRAASFLAVTYSTNFPREILFAKHYFKEGHWKAFVQ